YDMLTPQFRLVSLRIRFLKLCSVTTSYNPTFQTNNLLSPPKGGYHAQISPLQLAPPFVRI
ncbi:hypothetical protein, partial [Marinibactrum halimedae]|uniref:hypothetical protein n=1 Tax=Marinibactrum halimedae TaxID=1444977 RepID=UPI0024E1900E